MGVIVDFISRYVSKKVLVILVSMMPISELRGSIPLGISLGFSPEKSAFISILGNMAIVPVLLLIIQPIFSLLKRIDFFEKLLDKIEKRAADKVKNYKKIEIIGLFLLVAIPFPTTGVYTGCVAANVLNIKFKNALISICAGVLLAGLIVYLVSSGAVNFGSSIFLK